MFSYLAVMSDPSTGSTIILEHPEGGEWRLSRDGVELPLAGSPRMIRDGGTVYTSTDTGESLVVPQQMSTVHPSTTPPTFNGRPLELTEWWLGGSRYMRGEQL